MSKFKIDWSFLCLRAASMQSHITRGLFGEPRFRNRILDDDDNDIARFVHGYLCFYFCCPIRTVWLHTIVNEMHTIDSSIYSIKWHDGSFIVLKPRSPRSVFIPGNFFCPLQISLFETFDFSFFRQIQCA